MHLRVTVGVMMNEPMPGGVGEDVDLFGRRPKGRPDWSHRRAEPRGLALAWALYLMLATMGSLIPAMTLGRFDPGVYRPAARILMAMIVVGIVVLWPMLRLSQRPAGGPGGGGGAPMRVGRDLAVLLIPAMTLVWPQVVLAGWSVEVAAAVSVLLVVWGFVAGAVLYVYRGLRGVGRWAGPAAMGVLIALVVVVPLVLWRSGVPPLPAGGAPAGVSPRWMWTPVTSVLEVLRERPWSGRPVQISPGHWIWIVRLLVGSGGLLWVSAWFGGRRSARLTDRRTNLEH